MKIFAFDPETGKRGEFLQVAPVATYTNIGLNFGIREGRYKEIPFQIPNETKNCRWTAHIDAGYLGYNGNDVSLLRDDEWVCFCMGNFGASKEDAGCWEWIVLPPKKILEKHKIS